MKAQIKLRAAKAEDLPRLRELWREGFPSGVSSEYFFENYFAADNVTSSLVLLEDGVVQSMAFFLPTFWYDETDTYAPAPCLVGLTTAADRQHRKYASWLVETACDFMVEKGAGAVWTILDDETLQLFFSRQGLWTMPRPKLRAVTADALSPAEGRLLRAAPEDYDQVRELLLRGKNHIVAGPSLSTLQRDMAERSGGGMFLLNADNAPACAIAVRQGEDVCVKELLCREGQQEQALALLKRELPARGYLVPEQGADGFGMLRLMNDFAKMEQPTGYLGCGALL